MLAAGVVLGIFIGHANAQSVLFSDTFDRANSRDIQASLTGITDNTGSGLAADTVYTQAWLDPNNAAPTYGAQDGIATNGGGAQISGNRLQLAVGSGTSEASINHNFINSSILSAGGFSVSLDVTGFTQTGYQQGGAFAIGMSASEAASVGDAFNQGLSPNPPIPSMTGAFNDASTIGANIPGLVASDFWLAIRGNNTLVWGGSSGVISGVTGLSAKTGTISADFFVNDFNAGSTVSYNVYLNGVSEGSGSFTWSGTDENYIGVDARDSTAVNMDNLTIATIAPVPEPASAALMLVGGAALFLRRRKA